MWTLHESRIKSLEGCCAQHRSSTISPNQMLLNDPLGVFDCNVLIPCPFGINHRDRTGGADAQTLAFGSIARAVFAGQV